MNKIDHDHKAIEHKLHEKRLQKWLRGVVIVFGILHAPSKPFAMTGAEFVQADKSFATGYVLGAIEVRISVLNENDPNFNKVRDCILASKATASTLYEMVASYIRRNPEVLKEPAIASVINTVAQMCISGGK